MAAVGLLGAIPNLNEIEKAFRPFVSLSVLPFRAPDQGYIWEYRRAQTHLHTFFA